MEIFYPLHYSRRYTYNRSGRRTRTTGYALPCGTVVCLRVPCNVDTNIPGGRLRLSSLPNVQCNGAIVSILQRTAPCILVGIVTILQ